MTQVVPGPSSDQSFLLEIAAELESVESGEVAGGSGVESNTMNVNGGRPTCLYNDPSVFVKTEFDTGMTQSISIYMLANFLGTYLNLFKLEWTFFQSSVIQRCW